MISFILLVPILLDLSGFIFNFYESVGETSSKQAHLNLANMDCWLQTTKFRGPN